MNKIKKILFISVFIVLMVSLNLAVTMAYERPLRTTWAWPAYIDPAIDESYQSMVAYNNLYDTLVFSDSAGEALPHVAESWEVSDDGLAWTFYIRQGIKFHDDGELTASDVKFSMDRKLAIGQGTAYLFLDQEIKTEVIDKYTVTFNLKKPEGPFLKKLMSLFIVNEDLIKKHIKKPGSYGEMGDYGKEYLLAHDAGSGSYMLKEVVLESHIDMVVNPNYWIPIDPNAPDELKMIGNTESVIVRTLLSKRELEITDDTQTPEAFSALEKLEGVKIAQYKSPGSWVLMLHTKKAPTDDVHFRKAMAWATDYETVKKYILVDYPLATGPIPEIIPGHEPTVFQYHRDLDKAMEELKKSKYYGQLDKYPARLEWCAEVPLEEKVALLFMSNMADIGIKVNVVKVPWMSMVNNNSSMDTSPNTCVVYPATAYGEAGSLLQMRYASSNANGVAQIEYLLDPEYDAKLEDAIATVDKDERFAKYAKMQHYIVELCPTIFLVDQVRKHAFQSDYVDWYAMDGNISPASGYDFIVRNIKIYPEKRNKLLE